MAETRVLIVDDHPLFRGALNNALSSGERQMEIVELGTLDELSTSLEANSNVDLILLDLSMPGVQGFSGLLYLRAQHPEIPVVIVSATEDANVIRRAIDFGASGFVPKSQPINSIRLAVDKVLNGEIWTPSDL
ncbi:MAG: response regulator transcription factor, partial [Pseudomonadota bacterium]